MESYANTYHSEKTIEIVLKTIVMGMRIENTNSDTARTALQRTASPVHFFRVKIRRKTIIPNSGEEVDDGNIGNTQNTFETGAYL